MGSKWKKGLQTCRHSSFRHDQIYIRDRYVTLDYILLCFHSRIEHMEEDEPDQASSLPRWVLLEYSQMLNLAGKDSVVAFTHLSKSSCDALDRAFSGTVKVSSASH